MSERQNIEWKKSWHDDYLKWICGFANAIGGIIYIGKDIYPLAALREMLLNALVHRTYLGAHIQLRVFDDRLSIWNEGGLPFGLTLEELKGEHSSRPRNPKIAKACFMAGYIDTWGRGTLKIYNSCSEHGLPEPLIREKDGGFQVTLFNSVELVGKGSAIGGAISGALAFLSDRQIAILKLIIENPKVGYRTLARKLSINPSAMQTHIDVLKEKQIIERIGGTRGYWKVKIKQ